MSEPSTVALAVSAEETRWLLERRAALARRPDGAAERDAQALEMYCQQFAAFQAPGAWAPDFRQAGYSSSREMLEAVNRAIAASLTYRELVRLLWDRANAVRDALRREG